jgi:hypothetical protein
VSIRIQRLFRMKLPENCLTEHTKRFRPARLPGPNRAKISEETPAIKTDTSFSMSRWNTIWESWEQAALLEGKSKLVNQEESNLPKGEPINKLIEGDTSFSQKVFPRKIHSQYIKANCENCQKKRTVRLFVAESGFKYKQYHSPERPR